MSFKKIVKILSWLSLLGGVAVAIAWSLISPGTASDHLSNATAPFVATVFGMMLVGLFGLAMTDDGKGGDSGPPFMWG